MAPSRLPLQVDAGRIFRWSFLLIFLAFEWMVWEQIRHRPRLRPGLRIAVFLVVTRRAAVVALIMAGTITVAAMLLVRLVVAPLLDLWLRPAHDPSSWLFHLSAGEAPEASVSARWRSGGGWRPGALVLTDRRIWFLPSAWGPEPWSMPRRDCERVEAEPSRLARFLPVRHWPDRVRFTDRSGESASFAVSDPGAVLGWFAPPRHGGDPAVPRPRVVPGGVFDA